MFMILVLIMILISVIYFLMSLFLFWGIFFPDSSFRLEGKIQRFLLKRSVLIVGDSKGYIYQRNLKLLIWLGSIFIGLQIIFCLVIFHIRIYS